MKHSNFIQMYVLGALLYKASKTSFEILHDFKI